MVLYYTSVIFIFRMSESVGVGGRQSKYITHYIIRISCTVCLFQNKMRKICIIKNKHKFGNYLLADEIAKREIKQSIYIDGR